MAPLCEPTLDGDGTADDPTHAPAAKPRRRKGAFSTLTRTLPEKADVPPCAEAEASPAVDHDHDVETRGGDLKQQDEALNVPADLPPRVDGTDAPAQASSLDDPTEDAQTDHAHPSAAAEAASPPQPAAKPSRRRGMFSTSVGKLDAPQEPSNGARGEADDVPPSGENEPAKEPAELPLDTQAPPPSEATAPPSTGESSAGTTRRRKGAFSASARQLDAPQESIDGPLGEPADVPPSRENEPTQEPADAPLDMQAQLESEAAAPSSAGTTRRRKGVFSASARQLDAPQESNDGARGEPDAAPASGEHAPTQEPEAARWDRQHNRRSAAPAPPKAQDADVGFVSLDELCRQLDEDAEKETAGETRGGAAAAKRTSKSTGAEPPPAKEKRSAGPSMEELRRQFEEEMAAKRREEERKPLEEMKRQHQAKAAARVSSETAAANSPVVSELSESQVRAGAGAPPPPLGPLYEDADGDLAHAFLVVQPGRLVDVTAGLMRHEAWPA